MVASPKPGGATITVQTVVDAPVRVAWTVFSEPAHIVQWNSSSADWHTEKAKVDLRVGGGFEYTIAKRDGSHSFAFGGTYTAVTPFESIAYTTQGDDRAVHIAFSRLEGEGDANERTLVVETFEPETINPPALQQKGWQHMLDNFKAHVEALGDVTP